MTLRYRPRVSGVSSYLWVCDENGRSSTIYSEGESPGKVLRTYSSVGFVDTLLSDVDLNKDITPHPQPCTDRLTNDTTDRA